MKRGSASAGVNPRSVPGCGAEDFLCMIEENIDRKPDALAVTDGKILLSYGELGRAAQALTRRLEQLGVRSEDPVALCMPRSVSVVVAMLAILQSGGAYVPFDPSQPAGRLREMIASCGARVALVSRARYDPQLEMTVEHVIEAEFTEPLTHEYPSPGRLRREPRQLSYIIFTSGSTGQPKGVAIEWAGLNNLVKWHIGRYHLKPSDRVSQAASPGFDAAGWEIWPTLAAGASLHIIPQGVLLQPNDLLEWLSESRITNSFLPTPLASQVLGLSAPPAFRLRTLLTGGDLLSDRPSTDAPFQLVNHYGPTETTVVATAGEVKPGAGDVPSIGNPIDGTSVHILDADLNETEPGDVGELYIGGIGLARGYVGQPAQTADRFLPNGFGDAGQRLYRTGDRCRLGADGSIEFVGRTDTQVQIRGLRVELGEVEARLRSHPEVREAVVIASVDRSRLEAFVLPDPDHVINIPRLRDYAREHLSSYMVPSFIRTLTAIPLTHNGKIDRMGLAALAAMKAHDGNDEVGTKSLSPLQYIIAEAWGYVLDIPDPISFNPEDDFFALGGHSLSAHQVVLRVNALLKSTVTVKDLFEAPTISRFANLVGESADPERVEGTAARLQEIARLSGADGNRIPEESKVGIV